MKAWFTVDEMNAWADKKLKENPHWNEASEKQDIPDLIAGALGVSRGTAYDLMREALAEQYARKNSLGGPAKVFDAMANAIRAGDDYHAVLRQYGYAEAQQQEPVAWGNFKEDGTLVGLSQHPEDQANWTGRKPLYTSPQAQQEPPGPLPSIVDAVEFRRKAYCLDCRQWSAVLGMGASHYSEFVNGKRELPKSAMAIAYEYGVPADALFQACPDKGASDIDRRLAELERQRAHGITGKQK